MQDLRDQELKPFLGYEGFSIMPGGGLIYRDPVDDSISFLYSGLSYSHKKNELIRKTTVVWWTSKKRKRSRTFLKFESVLKFLGNPPNIIDNLSDIAID